LNKYSTAVLDWSLLNRSKTCKGYSKTQAVPPHPSAKDKLGAGWRFGKWWK